MHAQGQTNRAETSETWIDRASKGLTQLGELMDSITPSWGPLGAMDIDPFAEKATRTRRFEESCPVRSTCLVSVSNKFGQIRVDTWENPVVRVQAQLTVGTGSSETAGAILEGLKVEVESTEDNVQIRLLEPDVRDAGEVAIAVDYTLTLPQGASLVCENYFGDTMVKGVGGSVGLESKFGNVDIRDVAGPVNVLALGGGEFSLQAHALRQGGAFELLRTQAEFSNISGKLVVSNYLGSTTLRDLAPESSQFITSESGPVHLFLAEGGEPDIEATVLRGQIKSDIPLNRQATYTEHLVSGQRPNLESKQQVSITASFDDVYIHKQGATEPSPPTGADGTELVTAAAEHTVPVKEGMEVVINSQIGDIQIEGVDSNELHVKANKWIRLESTLNAAAVRDALDVSVEALGDRVRVQTHVKDDMASLGCTYYRVDLTIECPRGAPLRITGSKGQTSVGSVAGPVVLEQLEGDVRIEHVKSDLDVTCGKGDATVTACGGPVKMSVRGGAASTRDIHGDQVIECVEGRTVIEAPHGKLVVSSRGGDVRIMAHDGVKGDFDVKVEEGDLSLLLPQDADAVLDVTAVNGMVYPTTIPLTGGIDKEVRWYKGRLKDGAHAITLRTKNGDIAID